MLVDIGLSEWGGWSFCSATCRVSVTNPVRYRSRAYCLNSTVSAYRCRKEEMIMYEPCNTDSCVIGEVMYLEA